MINTSKRKMDCGNGRMQENSIVEITDTVSLNNIYLQVRHTVEYPMSNLYMFVHIKGPTGQF